MKTTQQQHFSVPASLPFHEIRTTLNSVSPYAEHVHSSFSFGLILEGRTCFSLGKKEYLAQPGDIVLIAPWQAHSCNPVEGRPRSYHMAYVDASWFHTRLGMLLHQQCGLRVAEPLVRDAGLFTEARGLLEALARESAASESDLAALLSIMQTRHRAFAPGPEEIPALAKDSLPAELKEGEHSVCALAKRAGVRRESFSRSFRRNAGLPPQNYLHCLRLEHGRHLLLEGSGIAEAAIASGYVDQSHFHRMFVKYCSVTPGCYRKNLSHSYKK